MMISFKKVTVLPDGKNHGLIFILDWSGSMGYVLHDTVKQLLSLVFFCRKGKDPIWRFTHSLMSGSRMMILELCTVIVVVGTTLPMEPKQNKLVSVNKWFNLLNILTHKVNAQNFERQCKGLFTLSMGIWIRKVGSIWNTFE